MSQSIVLKKTMGGKNLVIRYPQDSDVEALLKYINSLSRERTFIRFQGEQLTLKEESKYLKNLLLKIKKNQAVQLLVFADNTLVGVSAVSMKDKVERHIGVFGISIAKNYRGQGLGNLLMNTIFKEAMKNLTLLETVILEVYDNNPLALTMYEKFGFIKYGKLPKGIIYKDKHIDDVLMYKPVK